ncbi:MAG TPA: hypothetical protein VKU90_16180 [Caulobacteraceae bacterium]|nr:hypothetical protein [Caulobacteraceae bacterium]
MRAILIGLASFALLASAAPNAVAQGTGGSTDHTARGKTGHHHQSTRQSKKGKGPCCVTPAPK